MQRPCVDSALIARWRDAIDQWEATGEGATSSITGGGAIRALEVAFGDRLDGRPCLSLGSGTAALAACLIGVGVTPGDHVLTSALDWPAATEAIHWVGAIPVYVDVEGATATISPEGARQTCDDRVTALVATHLFGIPADVPALRSALPSGIAIVEDCAQALGAQLDDAAVGTLGDAAAFSFGPGKMIDAGEADDKIIAVAAEDKSVNHINNIEELPSHFNSEIKHFFEEYKRLEKKTVLVEKFQSREIAMAIIAKSIEDYNKEFGTK